MRFSALIGDPVEHSVSPFVFNYIANYLDIEYAHIKLECKENELCEYIEGLRTIGASGFNVTLPYKVKINEFVDELDESAERSGAINTVKINNSSLIAYNTDGKGAISAINHCFGKLKKSDRIVVFGSGGCARGVISEAKKYVDEVYMIARNSIETENLLQLFQDLIVVDNYTDNIHKVISRSDIVINCTPVGMYPDISSTILTMDDFEKIRSRRESIQELKVFDTVFNPGYTLLLRNAKKSNCDVCSGLWMLIHQAIYALEIWIDEKIVIEESELENLYNLLMTKINRIYC
ncbi:shikimate dehydrogenase [Paenibacillus lautus]|uniref:shikimate dehydrogenase n=1 Tax=Paenibacillus lautus TaxID=1401 RepID=UPI003D2AEA0B